MVPIGHYLFLSLALFAIGVVGVVTRRNVIIILMSVELILNAVNINLVAFSRPSSKISIVLRQASCCVSLISPKYSACRCTTRPLATRRFSTKL